MIGWILLSRSGIVFGAVKSPSKSKLASFATCGRCAFIGSAAGSGVFPKSRIFGSGTAVRALEGGLGRGGGVEAACIGGGGRAGYGIGLDCSDFTGALVTEGNRINVKSL